MIRSRAQLNAATEQLTDGTWGRYWLTDSYCYTHREELLTLATEIMDAIRIFDVKLKHPSQSLEWHKSMVLISLYNLGVHIDWQRLSDYAGDGLWNRTAEVWLRSQELHFYNPERVARGFGAATIRRLYYFRPERSGFDGLASALEDRIYEFDHTSGTAAVAGLLVEIGLCFKDMPTELGNGLYTEWAKKHST